MKLQVKSKYGPLHVGQFYKVLSEGYDGVKISYQGHPIWVQNWVFEGELEEDVDNYDFDE